MRTSPNYVLVIGDLAEAIDPANTSVIVPEFEIENTAAAISAAHGVSMDDVWADVDAIVNPKG